MESWHFLESLSTVESWNKQRKRRKTDFKTVGLISEYLVPNSLSIWDCNNQFLDEMICCPFYQSHWEHKSSIPRVSVVVMMQRCRKEELQFDASKLHWPGEQAMNAQSKKRVCCWGKAIPKKQTGCCNKKNNRKIEKEKLHQGTKPLGGVFSVATIKGTGAEEEHLGDFSFVGQSMVFFPFHILHKAQCALSLGWNMRETPFTPGFFLS